MYFSVILRQALRVSPTKVYEGRLVACQHERFSFSHQKHESEVVGPNSYIINNLTTWTYNGKQMYYSGTQTLTEPPQRFGEGKHRPCVRVQFRQVQDLVSFCAPLKLNGFRELMNAV